MPSTQYSDKYWNLNQNKHIVNPIVYTLPRQNLEQKNSKRFWETHPLLCGPNSWYPSVPSSSFRKSNVFAQLPPRPMANWVPCIDHHWDLVFFFAMIKPALLGGCCGCWMLKKPFQKGTNMSKTLQNTGRHQQSSIRIRWDNVDNADVVDVFDSYLCAWREKLVKRHDVSQDSEGYSKLTLGIPCTKRRSRTAVLVTPFSTKSLIIRSVCALMPKVTIVSATTSTNFSSLSASSPQWRIL